MSSKTVKRAQRLERIARIGDAIAKAAEGVVSQRRSELAAQEQRLSVVEAYCQDYAQSTRDREAAPTSVVAWRQYREFSGWLSTMSITQRNEVAQAQFMVDSALDEALQKRNFARALEKASDRAATTATREATALEQKAMDALARPMGDALAS